MILSYHPVHLAAKAYHNIAQVPVIHIQTALPDHLSWIDLKGIPLLDVIIQHSRKQVISRRDRMEISCKMKIQILHGNNLRISASGSSSFDPEARAKGRLTKGDDRFLIKLRQRLPQANRRRRLTLSCRSRIDRSHKYQLPVRPVFDPFPHLIGKLRLILSIEFQFFLHDPYVRRHIPDVCHLCFLCNLNICFHWFPLPFLLSFHGYTCKHI